MKNALIIFVRNPEMGKVKTRIAQTAGNEKALHIYKELLHFTHAATQYLACDKFVFYADYVNENDLWTGDIYHKQMQYGNDLGQRMHHAFELIFSASYQHVCIIGSDCLSLTQTVIEEAFFSLTQNDVVVGPSTDGGYYLLGMNVLHELLFKEKNWSSDDVLAATLQNVAELSLTYKLLPALTDVDTEADWINEQHAVK